MPEYIQESRIVDRHGQAVFVKTTVPDLDRKFWMTAGGGDNARRDATMSRPLTHHAWLYRAWRAIVTNLQRLPFEIRRAADDEVVTPTERDLATLFTRPNELMSWGMFREAVFTNLLKAPLTAGIRGRTLGGTCFIVPWDTANDSKFNLKTAGNRLPGELLVFDDGAFEPRFTMNARGLRKLAGWKYKIDNGKEPVNIDFDNEEIIWLRLYNPYEILAGAAPMLAIGSAIEQDVNADIYNTAILKNDGRPSGILTTDEDLTEDQSRETLKRWNEAHGGPGNARRTALLSGMTKYQQIALSPSDMEFGLQREYNKEQIIAAFGLNRIALGDYEDINLATIREGRALLWTDTYIPLDEMFWDSINTFLLAGYKAGTLKAYSDYSNVKALKPDQTAASQVANTYVNMGFPPSLAARLCEIPLTAEDLKRWPHLNEPLPRTVTAATFGLTGEGVAAFIPNATAAHPAEPTPPKAAPRPPLVTLAGMRMERLDTEEKRAAYSADYIERVLVPIEKTMFGDVRRFFYKQRNEMQDRVDAWLRAQKHISWTLPRLLAETRSPNVDPAIFLLDEDEETKKLLKMYRPHAKKQMQLEAAKIEEDLGNLIEWNVTEELLDIFVNTRKQDIKRINTNTFTMAGDVIGTTVEQGMNEEWTVKELADTLKEVIGDVMGTRVNNSMTIARTEMGIIASETRFDAFRTEGVERQEWLSSRDLKVRDQHQFLDGKVAVVGREFEGSSVRFPRDPMAANPGEIINCRCVAIAYFDDEED